MTPAFKDIRSDTEIRTTFAVLRQLRPHLTEEGHLETVKRMQHSTGYRLAALIEGGQVRCVAGYRITEHLAWGRLLSVEDLVTDEHFRSKSYGKQMFDWLVGEAKRNDCEHLHLECGVQRPETHRFYIRERMSIVGYHFSMAL